MMDFSLLSERYSIGFALGMVFGIIFTLVVEAVVYYYLRTQRTPNRVIDDKEEGVIKLAATFAFIALVVYIITTQGQDMNEVLTGSLIAIIGAGVVDKKIAIKTGRKKK